MKTDRTRKIAELNDLFRMEPESYGHMGRQVITEGIASLPLMVQFEILDRVHTFEAFTDENDPHGEHDFGAFECQGHKVFWKIDYYNQDLTGGGNDPGDWANTTRVLTTMLASEY